MATITPVKQTVPDDRTRVYLWEQINQDDEGGVQMIPPAYADKTVHVVGTLNGGTYTLSCSMDNVNFVPARDVQGNNIALTAAGARTIASNALYWRIDNDNAGVGEDVDVYIVAGL